MGGTAAGFLDGWLNGTQLDEHPGVWILRERDESRSLAMPALKQAVQDHLVGLHVIEKMGGFRKAAEVIKNRLPQRKAIRSGDFGEILATEYVDQKTSFSVPIRRLRYKDDRDTAMRGDDVIAVRAAKGNVTQVLKVEAKSRASLTAATLRSAGKALMKHSARPNPSTLAFISTRLREQGRDDDAVIIEQLQQHEVRERDVEHLIFTFSGNDPATVLAEHAGSPKPTIKRHVVGVVVTDHQAFIKDVFEGIK